jgi:hypothetical protein
VASRGSYRESGVFPVFISVVPVVSCFFMGKVFSCSPRVETKTFFFNFRKKQKSCEN